VLPDHDRRTARPWRSLIGLPATLTAMLLVLLLALAGSHATAAADCTVGGSGCLPGTGYTFDDTWDCGAITGDDCYYDTTTSAGSAVNAHWGWGSASYDGTGDVFVCIQGGSYFIGCAFNIARACFFASCDDQDAVTFPLFISNQSGVSHTISGHGKA
jgi:hypothetical protein